MPFPGFADITTAPAPTRASTPTVTPPTIVAFEPIDARRRTSVGVSSQSPSACRLPSSFVAWGSRPFVNITPCAIITSSSITTPSQTKECDEILQDAPMRAFFWISTKGPILVWSPIVQP
jgi:hypothetical protein